jgi:hypothetical protein
VFARVRHFCYTQAVPTTQPRISTVVERPLYEAIKRLAARDSVSVSDKARSLLIEALELFEDAGLEGLVARRRKTSKRAYSLAEVKRRLKIA